MTRLAALLAACWLALLPARAAMADDILVFAAASLKNALDEASADFTAHTGNKVLVSYAASGPLAKQIENGAPADLFISADIPWMDEVAGKDLIQRDSRVDLLGNRLVLVAAKDSTVALTLAPGVDLLKPLGPDGRLAIGDPSSVPAGKYAETALTKLGVWDQVTPRLARADSVRSALALVSRGEAPLGVVYATDAAADPAVRIVATFAADLHPAIVYPAALLAQSHKPAAADFLSYLMTAPARGFFAKQGFTPLTASKS